MPDVKADWWTVTDVAEYLGVVPSSVRSYVANRRPAGNPIPEPDRRIGSTPVWRPRRIVEWNRSRPGRGYWRKSA